MKTAMTENRIHTNEELRFFLDWIAQATECHVYDYDYMSEESSEDPVAQLFGVDETMNWIVENPAYNRGGEMAGYLVEVFNRAGHYCEIIF